MRGETVQDGSSKLQSPAEAMSIALAGLEHERKGVIPGANLGT